MIPNEALPAGTRLGGCTIDGVLSEDEFGFVYRITDSLLLGKVAIKEYFPRALCHRAGLEVVVRDAAAEGLFAAGWQAFVEEGRLLSRLQHPALMRVVDTFELHNTLYCVMPLHDGVTLADARAQRPDSPDVAWLRDFMLALLAPLEMLHEQGLLHGDVQPGKILLGEGGMPCLMGFGNVRRALGGVADAAYAPVEQLPAGGHLPRGAWTDLYSLGAVTWFAATGRAPVRSVDRQAGAPFDAGATMARAIATAPGRERDRTQLAAAVARAMAVRPADRLQTGAELRAIFTASGPAATAAPAAPAPERATAAPSTPSPMPAPQVRVAEPPQVRVVEREAPVAEPHGRVAAPAPEVTAMPPAAAAAPTPEPAPRRADPPAAQVPPPAPRAAPEPTFVAPLFAREPEPAVEPVSASPRRHRSVDIEFEDTVFEPPPVRESPALAEASAWRATLADSAAAARPAEAASVLRRRPPKPGSRLAAGVWGLVLVVGALAGSAAWYRNTVMESGRALVLPPTSAGVRVPPAEPVAATPLPPAAQVTPPAVDPGPAALPSSPATATVTPVPRPAAPEAAIAAAPAAVPTATMPVREAVPAAATGAAGTSDQTAAAARTAPADEEAAPRRAAPVRNSRVPADEDDAARVAGAATPRAACGARANFALHYCMQAQCRRPQFSAHPQCRELFRTGEVS